MKNQDPKTPKRLSKQGAASLAAMYRTPWREVIFKDPQMTINEVRRLERSDPDCTRWPRFKQSDDATVIALDVDAGAG
jgi:hypothetical protein